MIRELPEATATPEQLHRHVHAIYKGRWRGFCKEAAGHLADLLRKWGYEARRCTGFVEVMHHSGQIATEEHWWVDGGGTIRDPTEGQYLHVYSYREVKEGDRVRTGKCICCGDPITAKVLEVTRTDKDMWVRRVGYSRTTFCSADCETGYLGEQS